LNSLQTGDNDNESSSETNLTTNSLQEWENDRGLSQDSIQEELEDEPLDFLLEISYVLCVWALGFLLYISLCFNVLGLGLLVRFW